MRRFFCLTALFLAAACSQQSRVPTSAPESGEPEWSMPSFAITAGGSSTAVNAQSGAATLTIPKPADADEGDFLLAHISYEKGNEVDFTRPGTVPAGWTLLRQDHFSSDIGQTIFYKFATGAEPASYTWGFKKSDNSVLQVRAAGGIIPYSGIDPDNPIVDSSGNSGDGLVLTAPSINAEAGSMIVAFFSHKKKTTLSLPTGMVHLYHVQHSNQSGPTIRASEELRTAAGATGSRVSNASATVGADKWVAQLVGLRAAPTVTVNKIVVNDALGAENDPGLFDLQVNGVTRLADAAHGDGTGQVGVSAGSSVTVGEVAGTDTDLDDYVTEVSCDNGKGSSAGTSHTFTINGGEDVICTITNTRKAVLAITKELVPDTDGGTFNLEIDGVTAGTGAGVGDGGTTGPVKLAPGDYTVGESGANGTDLDDYLVEISGDCAADGSITLTSGQEASCTITNTRKAVLTVTKELVPDTDGGAFNLEIDGVTAGTGAGVGDGGTTGPVKLAPGDYVVGESGANGTDLDDYLVEIGGDCDEDGSITLAAGQVASCTITNTRKAVLTVTKDLVPSTDDGTFNLEIDGVTAGTGGGVGDGGTTGPIQLAPGDYVVGESGANGTDLDDYDVEIGGDCDVDGSITLVAGQVASCTITNTREAAGFTLYLHNNPTPPVANTTRQENLPFNSTAPTAVTLFNYNTTDDNNAGVTGRFIDKSALGNSETDLQKFQTWRTGALGADLVVAGNVELRIWAKMKASNKNLQLRAFLRECTSTTEASCTLFATGNMTAVVNASSSAFVEYTVSFPSVPSTTINTGNRLSLKVVMVDISNADPAYLAYDTVSFPARVIVP